MLLRTGITALALLALPLSAARGLELPAPATLDAVPVCYNYGCREMQTISLSKEEWSEIAGWLTPAPANAAAERQAIRHAIGWMEVVVGRHTPTHRDLAGVPKRGAEWPGQLDCIDEAVNTTTYLRLLESEGLLRYHRVLKPINRYAVFDQHWAGHIQEIETGQRYVVDSWFLDNGYLPDVLTAEQWKDIPFWTSFFDTTQ